MTTVLDIAREYFPSFDDDMLDMFLWEFTGFPMFWGGDAETVLRRQLSELAESMWWDIEADMFPY